MRTNLQPKTSLDIMVAENENLIATVTELRRHLALARHALIELSDEENYLRTGPVEWAWSRYGKTPWEYAARMYERTAAEEGNHEETQTKIP